MIDLDLYIRQMGLINPEALDFPIGIVGAGSIGSWTALLLGKLGCQNIKVFDFDDVENHNAGSQLYTSLDAGKKKIEALQERLVGLVETLPNVEDKKIEDGKADFLKDFQVVIAAVDNIDTRKWIFNALKGTKTVYIDGRMGGNAIQIFCTAMDDEEQVANYAQTIFPTEETEEVPCSERSVAYNCGVIAGLIADYVAQLGNGRMPPAVLDVDLYNFTMYKD